MDIFIYRLIKKKKRLLWRNLLFFYGNLALRRFLIWTIWYGLHSSAQGCDVTKCGGGERKEARSSGSTGSWTAVLGPEHELHHMLGPGHISEPFQPLPEVLGDVKREGIKDI